MEYGHQPARHARIPQKHHAQNARVLHRRARSRPCTRPRGYSGIKGRQCHDLPSPDPAGGREPPQGARRHGGSILPAGTDDLRLGGAAEGKDLIDITGFDFNTITEKDGKVYIGALCTLQDVIESELVPAFIREAAGFCASFAKRNSATVGGNLGLRRSDSYLAAALTAADAVLKSHHAARRAGQARRRIPAKRLQASDRVCRGR